MNFYKLIINSIIASSFLWSSTPIAKKARQSGLRPIPMSQKELLKLTDPNHTLTKEKIELGKKLYFEPRLSKSGIISCNTCHNLGLGGVDGVATAVGHRWRANPHHLNSPTVYNAVFFLSQFWDGRSPHLEDQAQGPMQATPEMASPKALVEKRINSIPEYVAEFQKAYGKDVKIDFKTITATIGIFERTLVTPSRFDDFLNGKKDALSALEKEGLEIFITKGCVICHTGIALGGTMKPFELSGRYKFTHIGDFRGDATGMVKTPTLRNITQTAPYFHNGAIWSLEDAIKEMGTVQLGIKISDGDAAKIMAFFGSLEGRKPIITYPQLPKSTDTTPKPDFK